MSTELILGLLAGLTILLLVTGLPLAFILGSVGIVFLLLLEGPHTLIMPILNLWGLMGTFIFIAIPLFIFMGLILQRSGIADDLFEVVYRWAGPLPGGLAMGVVFICIIIAAMSGTSGAATVSMGFIAIPPMLKRGYDRTMVTGTVQAAGALGFLIPPSVTFIIYAMVAGVSVGRLFASGIFPGLMLAGMFIIYIGIRCRLQPHMGPPLPPEERTFTLRQKLVATRGIVLPALLVLAVLGSIFAGICSPTEASALGAAGAIICAIIRRRLTFTNFKEALFGTARTNGMVMWIVLSATVYGAIFDYFGASELIENLLVGSQLGPWGVLIVILLSFFIFGCFLDETAVLFIVMPIYLPILLNLGFDLIWFGVLYVLIDQTAYLTPPFGYNLFYMRGITRDLFRTGNISEEVPMIDIYRSVIPFIVLQLIGCAIVMIYPQIALWLPNKLFGIF